jgi:hypothetical protein
MTDDFIGAFADLVCCYFKMMLSKLHSIYMSVPREWPQSTGFGSSYMLADPLHFVDDIAHHIIKPFRHDE